MLETILYSIIASFCSVATIAYFGKTWFENRLRASIQHEYNIGLEKFKSEQSRKEKAAVVAEFLSEWTHVKDGDTKRLNQLLWELSLYLPSHLVKDIKSMVSSRSGKTASELLVSIRSHLLDGKDPITTNDIVHFKHPQNNSMVSGKDYYS